MNTIIFTHLIIEPDYIMISKGGCGYVNLSKISDKFIKDFQRLGRLGVKTKLDKNILKEAKSINQQAMIEYHLYLDLYNEVQALVYDIEQGIEQDKFKVIMDNYQVLKDRIDILLSYSSTLGKFRKLINNLV